MTFSRFQNLVRIVSAMVFLLAGTFKFLAPFGDFLAKLQVPFPHLTAFGVAALEIGGGATLLFAAKWPRAGRKNLVRLVFLALAFDMFFAIVLVGAPGKRGRVFRFGEHEIGGESWRLPLEILLLAAMLWFVFQPPPERE